MTASFRMSNSLRYRKSDDPGQTYMTPEYASHASSIFGWNTPLDATSALGTRWAVA